MSLKAAERRGKKFVNPVPTEVGGLTMAFKVAPKFFFGGAKRVPKRPLGPFRTDAAIYATPAESGLRVTWFGHSSSLLEIDGVRVLIDPVWDERASPTSWSGPKRFFPPTIALADLPELDVVLLSHDHYDHLGAKTIRELARLKNAAAARWITTLEVGKILAGMGVDRGRLTELDWLQSVQVKQLKITALPARHFSGRSLFNRFETLWASFALTTPQHRVYYGADSGEWFGFREIGEQYGPFDLTMLEVGAFNELWADIHMGPAGAIRSFRAMGGHGLLMPIHWALFDLGLHHWKEPIEEVFAEGDLKIWAPVPGEPTEVSRGVELRSEWWQSQE